MLNENKTAESYVEDIVQGDVIFNLRAYDIAVTIKEPVAPLSPNQYLPLIPNKAFDLLDIDLGLNGNEDGITTLKKWLDDKSDVRMKVLSEVGNYKLVKPEDKIAYLKLGYGTHWCTSIPNTQSGVLSTRGVDIKARFDTIKQQVLNSCRRYGNAYIIFEGDKPLIQIDVKSDQIMNVEDEPLGFIVSDIKDLVKPLIVIYKNVMNTQDIPNEVLSELMRLLYTVQQYVCGPGQDLGRLIPNKDFSTVMDINTAITLLKAIHILNYAEIGNLIIENIRGVKEVKYVLSPRIPEIYSMIKQIQNMSQEEIDNLKVMLDTIQ
jgi:hypothetical protein